jgi:glycyl-tRNA synthetase
MVTGHDDLAPPPGAPDAYEMVGLDCTIIMHPQVWKCSGHYDLFVDKMVDCRESKKRYRYDQVPGRWVEAKGQTVFVTTFVEENHETEIEHARQILQSAGQRRRRLPGKAHHFAGQNRPGSMTKSSVLMPGCKARYRPAIST